MTRNIKQKRLKSQTKVIPELVGSPTQSTSSRAAYSASHRTSVSVSSGVTSGDSSDSTGSSERRRSRPVTLHDGSTLSGETGALLINCPSLLCVALPVTVPSEEGINKTVLTVEEIVFKRVKSNKIAAVTICLISASLCKWCSCILCKLESSLF